MLSVPYKAKKVFLFKPHRLKYEGKSRFLDVGPPKDFHIPNVYTRYRNLKCKIFGETTSGHCNMLGFLGEQL